MTKEKSPGRRKPGGFESISTNPIKYQSAVAAVIAIVSTMIPLWGRLGVASKVQNVRLCLYFIPMIILATGNI